MKKIIAGFLLLVLAQGSAAAAERGSAEYEKLKEYKKTQREKREREKADPAARKPGFWAREGSRSGLTGTGNMFGNMIGSVIPGDKPGSRKE